jgi:hypothetical protein
MHSLKVFLLFSFNSQLILVVSLRNELITLEGGVLVPGDGVKKSL